MSLAKSGIKVLKPGEVLFEDGESAGSLYIIQKGQLRLYKPKGKGFIEIAVLRAGEVIGEMAYFDEKGGGKRSCSASAMVTTDIIEISFSAFTKAISALNPWFKTIINTLAKRLRETNSRVKELENNSASIDYGTGKTVGYEFLKANDIIKILGSFFLIYKAHGELHSGGLAIHRKTIDLYMRDIYNVMEAKLDEVILILEDVGLFGIAEDSKGNKKVHILKKIDTIRSIFVFYNTQKHLVESEKLKISSSCEIFLEALSIELERMKSDDDKVLVPITDLLENWKKLKEPVHVGSLDDARLHGIVGDVILDKSAMFVEVYSSKIRKSLPHIRFMNRLEKSNNSKRKF